MKSFDIRNVQVEDEIFYNFYLEKQVKTLQLTKIDNDFISKKHILAYSIRFIPNKKLLENTKKQFEKITKITTETKDLNSFYFENYVAKNYTELELVQIESHFYSFYYLFKLNKAMFYNYCEKEKQEFPEFIFKINNHIITHNFDEISEFCSVLMLNNSVDLIDELNLNKENELKIYLNTVNRDAKIDKETKKKFIDYYTIAKDNLVEEKIILLKNKKSIFDFVNNVNDKEQFINDLKETFPTEIGKSIKAIIDILHQEEIIIYGFKEFSQLCKVLEVSFDRYLGSYNSIQNVKTEDNKDTTNIVGKKLNPLIIKYKIN